MIFFLICSCYLVLISLLSAWLNYLYKKNKSELDQPHQALCPWPWRTLKICIITSVTMGLTISLLPNDAIGFHMMTMHDILQIQPVNSSLIKSVIFFILYSSFLLIMMWSDMEQKIIMNHQLTLFAILGVCYQLLLYSEQIFLQFLTAIASGILFLLLAIITRGGIAGGDIKLLAALGLWLKPEAMEITGIGGIILGGLLALMAILSKRKSRKDYIPYGPGFIVAALFAYFL